MPAFAWHAYMQMAAACNSPDGQDHQRKEELEEGLEDVVLGAGQHNDCKPGREGTI